MVKEGFAVAIAAIRGIILLLLQERVTSPETITQFLVKYFLL
jgi:ABC-type phosphate/phosphonate transport system permease subunit